MLKLILHDGFLKNQWGWFHGLAGGIFAWFLPVRIIFTIAIFWEIAESLWHKYRNGGVEKVYGSKGRFIRDSFGDIMLAIVFAEIVKLYPVIHALLEGLK